MKAVIAAAVLAACASAAAAQGIAGSAHDPRTWGLGITESCVPCHASHRALNPNEGAMWNHRMSSATFTMYGTTRQGTMTDPVPNKQTKLCLACHDGVTAVDAFGSFPGTAPMTGPARVGTDLHNEHPVSILYDYAVTTAGNTKHLRDPSTFVQGNFSNVPWLFDGKVECASCHDVHNRNSGHSKFLRVSTVNSELCAKCHDI